jgi:hypothetical protein
MTDMSAMQITIWTPRPSELLREVARQYGQSQRDADELVKHGKFNGLFTIFTGLSEAQFCTLENAAARLSLQYGNQQANDAVMFDTRWYPSGTAYDKGMHDAEIDLWHFKRIEYPRTYHLIDAQNVWSVQENSPREAIANSISRIQQVLDQLNAIPEHQQSPEARDMMAHHEGYLKRVQESYELTVHSRPGPDTQAPQETAER